ncbi:MAG: DUF47 family protein [Anaerolineales bacterium]|nr:DUF47 family protein [Anaerolineales bacterium]
MLSRKKKRTFDQIFQEHIHLSLQCAKELNALFSDFSNAEHHIGKIITLEKEADYLVAETFQLLDNTFISRYDKPDIERFISHLDDVTDYIKKATVSLRIYRIQAPIKEGLEFVVIINDMVKSLDEAIGKISSLKMNTVEPYVIHLKELEEKADELQNQAIQNLFEDEPDPKLVIKWKDIIEKMETVTDHAEDVINVLSSIVRKESL